MLMAIPDHAEMPLREHPTWECVRNGPSVSPVPMRPTTERSETNGSSGRCGEGRASPQGGGSAGGTVVGKASRQLLRPQRVTQNTGAVRGEPSKSPATRKEKGTHAVKPEEQETVDAVLVAGSVTACEDPNADGSLAVASLAEI